MKQSNTNHNTVNWIAAHLLHVLSDCIKDFNYPIYDINTVVNAAYKRIEKYNRSVSVHDIRILDNTVLCVDGELFRIYRRPNNACYNVRHIGKRAEKPGFF